MLNKADYYGFTIAENDHHEDRNDILHCAVVGLLIFCSACGCVIGIAGQFELTINYPVVLIVLFIAAMYLSLIHISKLFYNLGYFAFLALFSYALFSLRTYANSGYQALLNIISGAYSDHFLLSSVREYTEVISDRYVTLTTVSIFLGLFLVLLLNVDVFNSMIFSTAFTLTFLPLQIGMYIGRYPSYLSFAFLFFSYFGIYLIRHSCHYWFVQPPTRRKPREYSFDYYDREGRLVILHKSNARAMLSLAMFALCVSLFFSVFTSSVISTSENEAVLNKSMAKTRLDENVKILTQSGLMGLFNRYEAKGGISGGKLGGVRSVSPDYEADLEVTFVPYSFETLYLKGYTSQLYTGSSWESPNAGTSYRVYMPSSGGPSSQSDTAMDRVTMEAENLKMLADKGLTEEASARMKVKNIDAVTGYLYTPYFIDAIPENVITEPASILKGYSATDSEREYRFVPYSFSKRAVILESAKVPDKLYDPDTIAAMSEYEQEVYSNYLQIPPMILDELESYHEAIGTADSVQGQIDLIYKYFLENYRYDMAPGATPYNRDFVTYFLKEQKRGYCSHFASAGAMLLRSYGIPARYVEGYVITTSGITESATSQDADSDYYYTGDNPLGSPNVITTEVSDGNAHAWVEVYVSGFGWLPVEFTVPDTDEDKASYADFLAALTGLLAPSGIDGLSDPDDAGDSSLNEVMTKYLNLKNVPMLYVFTGIVAVLMLIPAVRRIFKAIRDMIARRKAYKQGDYAPVIRHRYLKAVKKLSRRYKVSPSVMTKDTFPLIKRLSHDSGRKGKRLRSFLESSALTIDDIHLLTLSCLYGNKEITKKDADLLDHFFKLII